jgi:hypothetical protein
MATFPPRRAMTRGALAALVAGGAVREVASRSAVPAS